MELKLHFSRRGIPCVWEEGGGWSNTGSATIIAARDGGKKTALYIRRRGQLAGKEHALVPVSLDDVIIQARHHRGDFEILIYRIDAFFRGCARCYPIAEFSAGEWDNTAVAEKFQAAVKAARDKAQCYHCREPHYVTEKGEEKCGN